MDRIMKQIDVHMYAIVCCPCTKFEKNRSRHLQEMAADGQTDAWMHGRTDAQTHGRMDRRNPIQAAILDRITMKMDMHMYVIEHCPNTNFE